MNIQAMMKQAKEMQERLQQQMAEMRVEATAGGGMVTVVMNGAKQVQSITIDPEVVSKDDVEMLQDLIVAAINDAQSQGGRATRPVDERPDGRPEDSRPLVRITVCGLRSTVTRLRSAGLIFRRPGRMSPRIPSPRTTAERTP